MLDLYGARGVPRCVVRYTAKLPSQCPPSVCSPVTAANQALSWPSWQSNCASRFGVNLESPQGVYAYLLHFIGSSGVGGAVVVNFNPATPQMAPGGWRHPDVMLCFLGRCRRLRS